VGEEFVVVGVFEAALFGAGDGGAEGGEEDDVVWVFLEDVFGAFLEEGHGCLEGLVLIVLAVVAVVARIEFMAKSRGRSLVVL
jgi:hypothetical protein